MRGGIQNSVLKEASFSQAGTQVSPHWNLSGIRQPGCSELGRRGASGGSVKLL